MSPNLPRSKVRTLQRLLAHEPSRLVEVLGVLVVLDGNPKGETGRGARWLRISAVVALLAGGMSCGHTTAVEPAPAVATSAPVAPPTPSEGRATRSRRVPTKLAEPPPSAKVGDVMLDHFLITSWARDAVVAGLLEPMKAPLIALADYQYGDEMPAGWAPRLAQLQAAARATSSATTLEAAAMGVATMGRICGECHTEKHAGPPVLPLPALDQQSARDTVPERMERHMFAVQVLWEGLTVPSEPTWKSGADALLRAPEQLDQELPATFDKDLQVVHGLGVQARDATTLSERADVFGRLIATCADCHTRWIADVDEK
jgi:cytochrome c553